MEIGGPGVPGQPAQQVAEMELSLEQDFVTIRHLQTEEQPVQEQDPKAVLAALPHADQVSINKQFCVHKITLAAHILH